MSPSLETIINWGDCDEAGVVHYPKYFYWMDSAFHGLLRNAGLSLRTIGQTFGAHVPIVEAKARFLARATFDEPLTVIAEIVHWGTKSFRVVYRGFRGDEQVFEGQEARVWALRMDGPIQTAPIPTAFKQAMTSAD
jgi:YbgC/YbaW family acyl-CoA thioester hydrolase